MRLKAIPAEIGNAVEAHPMLALAGAVVIGAGIYYYQTNRSPTDYYGADPNASTQSGYTYGMPMVIPQGVASGIVDAVTNPAVGGGAGGSGGSTGGGATDSSIGSVSDLDIFNFEKLKELHDYDLASRALDANVAIALVNADVAMQGIQATNWQTSAGLAANFLRSGQAFFAGNVGGQTFAFLGTGATVGSNRTAENAFFNSLVSNPNIQSLLSGSNTSGLQSGTGALSVTPIGGSTASTPSGASGSTSIASALSSPSPSSPVPSIFNGGTYATSSYGGGGSGGAGGASRFAASL